MKYKICLIVLFSVFLNGCHLVIVQKKDWEQLKGDLITIKKSHKKLKLNFSELEKNFNWEQFLRTKAENQLEEHDKTHHCISKELRTTTVTKGMTEEDIVKRMIETGDDTEYNKYIESKKQVQSKQSIQRSKQNQSSKKELSRKATIRDFTRKRSR